MEVNDSEALLLHEIERLEILKKRVASQYQEIVEKIQDTWNAFGTAKYSVLRGDIVESDGVRYVAVAFTRGDFARGEKVYEAKVWLRATLESDTSDNKEVYNLYNNWRKVEKTA